MPKGLPENRRTPQDTAEHHKYNVSWASRRQRGRMTRPQHNLCHLSVMSGIWRWCNCCQSLKGKGDTSAICILHCTEWLIIWYGLRPPPKKKIIVPFCGGGNMGAPFDSSIARCLFTENFTEQFSRGRALRWELCLQLSAALWFWAFNTEMTPTSRSQSCERALSNADYEIYTFLLTFIMLCLIADTYHRIYGNNFCYKWTLTISKQLFINMRLKKYMRRPGIEPGSQEWESCMIPLHQRRRRRTFSYCRIWRKPQAWVSDLILKRGLLCCCFVRCYERF